MIGQPGSGRAQWSSGFVFLLALVGTTVGLGNIWRFPYLAGQHGGGAFLLLYAFCVLVVALPLMVAELAIGRHGRRGPYGSIRRLVTAEARPASWRALGLAAVIGGLLLLSGYSVVGGWSLAYVFRSASGVFDGVDALQAAEVFRALTADPERLLAWHTVFMAVTVVVVGRGLRDGVEAAIRWFVPALTLTLVGLVAFAWGRPGFEQAWAFLFRPDFSQVGPEALLAALGHAFFSLSIGMGALMAFGAYASAGQALIPTALAVVVLDTLLAVLAGLAVFPLVFEAGLPPESGPGLLFQSLPLAFGSLPGGRYLATLFFAMLALAAWTSAFAMLEPAVASLAERPRMDRAQAGSIAGLLAWALGLVPLLSFNVLADNGLATGQGGLFELYNLVTTGVLLPAVGLATALFAGWVVRADTWRLELRSPALYPVWLLLIRFVTPVAMALVFLQASGLLGPLADWKSL
ncbi:sodium-dependent transporter [Sediminicurvatus halobius]|uniref:sodium-dependent transporter n=1 Tax=Sediminicurvatus halobius TaxID=2182432 RepID=UPI001E53F06D|nr:sodium-dependent transporter [Spiribacter halobius]UEX79420.1 sodium-dependent transporter [Spiribacter halobius]